MRTKVTDANGATQYEIGDLSPEFGIHSFFPQKLQPFMHSLSDFCYALLNMCGLINCLRKWLQGSSTSEQVASQNSGAASGPSVFSRFMSSLSFSSGSSSDKKKDKDSGTAGSSSASDPEVGQAPKKDALDSLDEEIETLNKKVKGAAKAKKQPSKLDSMALKQMEMIGKMGAGAKGKDHKKPAASSGWDNTDIDSG